MLDFHRPSIFSDLLQSQTRRAIFVAGVRQVGKKEERPDER
jgi:hypothetical protein